MPKQPKAVLVHSTIMKSHMVTKEEILKAIVSEAEYYGNGTIEGSAELMADAVWEVLINETT